MVRIPSKGNSLWVESTPRIVYDSLMSDLNVDIAIIGGGIVGLTTAYLLKRAGKQVAVFDKWQVGGDISGFTTAKITSQHGLTYSQLIKKHGKEAAKLYGQANQVAIDEIRKIITRENIDCDFQRHDNYVFTTKQSEVDEFIQEASDAKSIGLPATFETTTPLPYAASAVRFKNQATFHIGKYVQGLARAVHGNGCAVYENTKVTNIRGGSPCTFRTPNGRVKANAVILATNVPSPIVMHGYYGLYEYPTRSYLIAGRSESDVSGMYINNGRPGRSILPIELNSERWLLIGGEGHFAGLSGPAKGHYDALEKFGRTHFGLQDVEYRWSTWDYVAYDKLPLVGKAYPFSKNVYTATGMRKWGMTNGTVAAMVLRDILTGTRNPLIDLYRPHRASVLSSLPEGIVSGIFG
jgi:glycine/D-amino acid oxidase-like deaminating enzyme